MGASRVDRFSNVEVGSVEIIFTGYAGERKESIAPRIGQARPHALRARHVFEGKLAESDAIHSPERMG